MPRSANQKKKLMILRKILLERTDENRVLTMRELISALAANDIRAERKSVYDDINALRELGLDVRVKRGKSVGYYVDERDFGPAELKLLADAVSSSKFITESQCRELMQKLAALAGANDRKYLNRSVYVSNRVRGEAGSEIYKSIDVLFEAMNADRQVSFKYFNWNAKKQKEYRRGGEKYTVSPWSLIWDDSHYYLAAFDSGRHEMRHYRVDKIESAAMIEESRREGEHEFKRYDVGTACEGSMFGMFGGRTETVTLRCDNSCANTMIDRFGRGVTVLNDGDSFRIHVKIVPGETFYGWVAGYAGKVRIISPDWVKEQFEETVKKSIE